MREFKDRPTVKEWKAHMRRLRWQRRIQQAPYVTLITWGLLIASIGLVLYALLR